MNGSRTAWQCHQRKVTRGGHPAIRGLNRPGSGRHNNRWAGQPTNATGPLDHRRWIEHARTPSRTAALQRASCVLAVQLGGPSWCRFQLNPEFSIIYPERVNLIDTLAFYPYDKKRLV